MAAMATSLAGIRKALTRPAPIDWLLAASFTLAAELEVLIRQPQPSWEQPTHASMALALFGLAWWRVQPLVPTAALAASAVMSVEVGGRVMMGVPQLAFFIATYSLGAYGSDRVLALGALLPSSAIVVMNRLLPHAPFPLQGSLTYYALFVTGAPILIGRLVRSRTSLVSQLEARKANLLGESEQRASRALTEERRKIATQLQNVVITSVDALLADVAVAEADPGPHGLAAVVRVEAVARRTLHEMRALLDALGPKDAERRIAADDLEPWTDVWLGGDKLGRAVRSWPWPPLLAAALVVAYELQIQFSTSLHGSGALNGLAVLLVAAPLAWSRSRPLAAATACLLAATAMSRLLTPLPIQGASVPWALYLVFSVAAFSNRKRAVAGLAICAIGFAATFGAVAALAAPIYLGAWATGWLLADRTRLARELDDTNQRLAAQREARAREVVLNERTNVARELHDVIGHTLTVVVLQAGAARRNWVADQARATRALLSLAKVAREGLTELLMSLDGLNESAPTTQAGLLRNIGALVEQARSAGVTVAFEPESLPALVNPELELATYRVVQESLTNVMKHAPRSKAHVRIQCVAGSLHVEVTNSGPPGNQPRNNGRAGQGLPGMAQRVEANGGDLRWGRDSAGGFAVRARLPIQAPMQR